MTHSTATVADVTAFRGRDFASGEFRRTVFGTFFIGIGSVAAISAMIGCVTVAAACIVAGLHAANSHSHLTLERPFTLGAQALTELDTASQDESYRDKARHMARDMAHDVARNMARDMSRALEVSAAVRALVPPAPVNAVKLLIFKAPATQVAATPQVATQQVAALPSADRTNAMPLPMRRPLTAPQLQAAREQAAHENVRIASAYAPETTSSVPAQTASFGSALQRLLAPQATHDSSALLSAVDNHTAVYDIEAHVVYLPNGEQMEAHSGLGELIDDPHHVNAKMHGATPPNVYNLVMREGSFHGVEAIRLTPVGDNSMYGRDGILAHPYMLGPSGQSFGCVSFRDYQAFLSAFKRGEVNRLVVVPHLDGRPPSIIRASRDSGRDYAFN
jgi:Protein of unknown function (DUF2778)